jgi:hypothetical protein
MLAKVNAARQIPGARQHRIDVISIVGAYTVQLVNLQHQNLLQMIITAAILQLTIVRMFLVGHAVNLSLGVRQLQIDVMVVGGYIVPLVHLRHQHPVPNIYAATVRSPIAKMFRKFRANAANSVLGALCL